MELDDGLVVMVEEEEEHIRKGGRGYERGKLEHQQQEHEKEVVAPPLGREGSRWVQNELRAAGLSVKKDALQALLAMEGGQQAVLETLDALQARQMTSIVITLDDIRAVTVAAGREGTGGGGKSSGGRAVGFGGKASSSAFGGTLVASGTRGAPPDDYFVIDAFSTPRVDWDCIRKSFYMDTRTASVLGRPESKVHMYRSRYHMLLQRVLRNRHFKRPALELGSSRDYCELTPLQALIGLVGVTKFVLGALNQLEDGRYFLEDTQTSVPVDLTGTQTATGMFTEGCVVVAEGALRNDGVFEVLALGFPPAESKVQSLQASPGVDFFGGGALSADDVGAMRDREAQSDAGLLVVLSEVHLDRAETRERLRSLFAGFEETGAVPAMYVLMGNFTSVGGDSSGSGISTTLMELRKGFKSLASIVSDFPLTAAQSKIVIMPGPGDVSPSQALPRPAFVDYFTSDLKATLPNLVLASSPCRIRFHSQYIILHRDNLLQKMRRSIVVPSDDGDDTTHFQQLTATVLQQSHLCPLPNTVQPTYWEFDHALSVYPMPELLVLGDLSQQQQYAFEGVESVNPGSFALDGSFLVYQPQPRAVDLSCVS